MRAFGRPHVLVFALVCLCAAMPASAADPFGSLRLDASITLDAGAPRGGDDPAEAPRRRARPLRLWPFLDLRSYDRALDGPDARLSEYATSFDLEVLWPLFAHYDWERTDGVRGGHTHVFPLLWSSWKDDEGYGVLFPFYWSRWTKEKSWSHFFPFYGRYEEGSYRKTFLLDPLFSVGRDASSGAWDMDLLWPLIHYESDGAGREGRFAPFLFYGDGPKFSYAHVPPVYFYHHRPGKSGTRVVFPFYWSHWSETGTKPVQRVVFPLYGRFEWQEGETPASLETYFPLVWKYRGRTEADVVLPLYWDFRDSKSRTRMVLPLWYDWKTPTSRGEVLFPFYWNVGAGETEGRTVALPPFYYLDRSRTGDRGTQAVTPFVWNWWSPESSGFLAWPFFGRHRGADTSVDTVLPPVFWRTRVGDTRGFIAAPLWWDFANDVKGDRFRALAPIYWDFARGRDAVRGTVLFPLYANVETSAGAKGVTVIPPWFGAWSERSRMDVVLPFFADVRDRTARSRWTSVLPPLYWWYRAPNYESEVLPPWWRFEDEATKETARGVFPLFWEFENGRRGSRTTLLLPLHLDVDEGPKGDRFTLWPFLWRYDDRSRQSRLEGLFPLYWNFRWKGGTEGFSTFFPVTWNFANPAWSFDYVFPFYGNYARKDGYRREFFLFPLASVDRDPARKAWGMDVLWPLFSWRDTPEETAWRALPFWLHHTRKSDGRTLDFVLPFVASMEAKDWSYFHAFPFYFSHLDKSEGEGRHAGWRSILGPLWTETFDEEEDFSRTEVLWPLFTARRKGAERSVSVRPLFYHSSDAERSGSVLLPLFFHHRWKDASETAVPPLYWERIRGDRSSRMLLPLYFEDTRPDRGTRVLFPVHWNVWSPGSSRLHWWPLFGLDREGGPSGAWNQFSLAWPFFRFGSDTRRGSEADVHAPWPFVRYHHQNPRGSWSFTGLPFFYGEGDAKQDRGDLYGLLPPFYVHWSDTERTALLPFFYHHANRRTERVENVLFPFLWSMESPTTSCFHLWPLFGRRVETDASGAVKRSEISAGWPFLFNLARDRGRERTALDLLWPLVHWSADPKRKRFRIAPLVWAGRDEGRERWSSFLPLWYEWSSLKRDDEWRVDLLWPLLSFERRREERHSRFIPLWWHDADEEESLTLVPLLSTWLYRSGTVSSAGILFPLAKVRRDRARDETQLDVLWPLFSYRRAGASTHARLLPLWWHDSDERSSLTVVPPLLSFHRRDGDRGFGSVLFPLTWYSWRRDRAFEFRVLWELARYTEGAGEAWDFRILYKFIHLGRRGTRFEFELMPLFRFETDRGRLTHFSLLGGALFSYDYDRERRRSEASLFYFIRF